MVFFSIFEVISSILFDTSDLIQANDETSVAIDLVGLGKPLVTSYYKV